MKYVGLSFTIILSFCPNECHKLHKTSISLVHPQNVGEMVIYTAASKNPWNVIIFIWKSHGIFQCQKLVAVITSLQDEFNHLREWLSLSDVYSPQNAASLYLYILATEQCANIIFYVSLHRYSWETIQLIEEAYGKMVMKKIQVYGWHKHCCMSLN